MFALRGPLGAQDAATSGDYPPGGWQLGRGAGRTRAGWWAASALVPVSLLLAACGAGTPSRGTGSAKVTIIRVTATPAGCAPKPALVPAGPVEVIATNLDAPTVSEVEIRTSDLSHVLGEKENLIEGLSATFTAFLQKGNYIVNCPGAARGHWRLVARATSDPKQS